MAPPYSGGSLIDAFGAETIVWRENVVCHDLDSFPELELTDHHGTPVRAYRNRPETVFELFAAAVEDSPHAEFLVFPESGDRYTYREVARRVDQVAAGMVQEGVTKGDRIALLCDSCPQFVELVFAAGRVGAVPMPLNTRHATRELRDVLADAAPDLTVVQDDYVEKLGEITADTSADRVFVVGDDDAGRPFETLVGDGLPAVEQPTATDCSIIMHTSGTTGQPKGVPFEHFHCTNAVLNNVHTHALDDGITNLVLSPLFHVTGLVCGLLTTAALGGTAVVLDGYGPERLVETIEAESVDYCMGVPTHIILAAEKVDTTAYDLSSFDKFAYGGAPMPGEVLPKIREAFPSTELYHSYGKTENFAGIASMLPDRYIDDRPESVGIPTPATKFAIVDEQRDRLPPGELGELAMYGSFVADLYLNRTAESDEEFHQGWHYTGDLGVIDEDGFITLKGRKGNMIIRGGENVYPAEIEDVLLAHDSVIDVAVGSFPDDVLGERILAAVVPREGTSVTEDTLRATCETNLADYKVPDLFRIVDELPRNANGKIQREELIPTPLQFGIKSGN